MREVITQLVVSGTPEGCVYQLRPEGWAIRRSREEDSGQIGVVCAKAGSRKEAGLFEGWKAAEWIRAGVGEMRLYKQEGSCMGQESQKHAQFQRPVRRTHRNQGIAGSPHAYGLLQHKDSKAKLVKRNGTQGEVCGDQAQIPRGYFLVELHRMCLISAAVSCGQGLSWDTQCQGFGDWSCRHTFPSIH